MRRLISISCLLAAIFGWLAVPQTSSADVTCAKANPITGVCIVKVPQRAKPERPSDKPRSRIPGGNTACTVDGVRVPCRHNGGVWSNSHRCYLKPLAKQPPKSDPSWMGHTTGAVYHCFQVDDSDTYYVWLATAPGVPAPPDPRTLAL